MNKLERTFDRVCNRFKLNPSGLIPNIKPDGVYEIGMSYESGEDFLNDKGTEVPIECFSIYNVFHTICLTRRAGRKQKGTWESLWGFLSDVNIGVYDTTNWVSVDDLSDDGEPA